MATKTKKLYGIIPYVEKQFVPAMNRDLSAILGIDMDIGIDIGIDPKLKCNDETYTKTKRDHKIRLLYILREHLRFEYGRSSDVALDVRLATKRAEVLIAFNKLKDERMHDEKAAGTWEKHTELRKGLEELIAYYYNSLTTIAMLTKSLRQNSLRILYEKYLADIEIAKGNVAWLKMRFNVGNDIGSV